MAKAKITKGSAMENIVIAVARVDYDDDHDGASFMNPEERRAARKLAGEGYLKLVKDERDEVIAKLTAKGLRLQTARHELAAGRERGPKPTSPARKTRLAKFIDDKQRGL